MRESDGWIDGWMDGWMDEWMDRWMDGWMDGWMEGWMVCGSWKIDKWWMIECRYYYIYNYELLFSLCVG